MADNSLSIWVVIHVLFFCLLFPDPTTASGGGGGYFPVPATARHGTVVKKDQRWHVASSEFGEISAVKVSDGKDGFYHLQFITMEPNSLFLPVHLHSDMVFYVDSGNGTLSWSNLQGDGDKLRQVKLQTGDVYRLRTGDVFYLQSNLEYDRRKLRINAIFSDSREELLEGSSSGAYSSVRDLVLGFDNKVLQAALNVKEEVIEELKQGERQAIVHGVAETVKLNLLEVHYGIMRAFLGGRMNINGLLNLSKKKDEDKDDKKDKHAEKSYNVLNAKRDVENCNGWSLVVTSQQLDALNNSNFGVYMVNLTKAAMMGPHWNPMTAEIGVVLRGRGMVHVVCPSATNGTECKNSRFKVEEGDVFVVPRYHPMAQMSFNNESFIFVGFTTTTKNNHPQFLVGTASVFQALDKSVLAASLGVSNTTMDKVLSAQREAIIIECVSCAEEEERLVEEEIEREKEEARKREEEEARKREEEEAKRHEEEKRKKEEEEEAEKARKEEEEARKREEEEAKRQEEEKRKKEEEEEAKRQQEEAEKARKEEEEEARKREEEKRRQEEEAEARRQEEEARRQAEEARKREEEEESRKKEEEKRRQEEEAEARRQEEEARKREEDAARQQEEEAARRQQEEEERRKQEEEAAKQWQQQQEEEAKRKQEEEAAAKQWQRQQEEEAKRKQEEEAAKQWQRQQEEEAKRKQEEEAAAKQWHRQQEEEAKRKQEEEAAKQWQRQQEEEAARHQQGGGGGGGAAGWDEGAASRQQEKEMERREGEAEAASRAGGGGGGGWQGNGGYEG